MKKVYYLCHCGSGTSVHGQLIELIKEEGNKLLFHIEDIDWDKKDFPKRTITLRAKKIMRKDFYGNDSIMIDFHSTKKQYQFHFIKEMEIEDNEEPEKSYYRS